jgi:hypothetical protein
MIKMTFFGGKNGFDYICFDENGILGSGKRKDMIKYATRMNCAVAKLYPVKYADSREDFEKYIQPYLHLMINEDD